MLNNFIALGITLGLAFLWLRINDFFAQKGWISSSLSRKIIHIGTGPIFILCWLLFEDNYWSRFLAALVPLAITIQFFLTGIGWIKDPASIKAMSRSGDRSEILRGPLYYGIGFVILTLVFWRNSPVGIIALCILCGGDGMADIFGSRINSKSLPWSKRKTIAGSIAMFLGSLLISLLVLAVYSLAGIFNFYTLLIPIIIISFVSSLVESLPYYDIDNLTVPAAAVAIGFLLIR